MPCAAAAPAIDPAAARQPRWPTDARWLIRWAAALAMALWSIGLVQAESATTTTPAAGEAVHITHAALLSVPGTGYSAAPQRAEAAGLPADGWQ